MKRSRDLALVLLLVVLGSCKGDRAAISPSVPDLSSTPAQAAAVATPDPRRPFSFVVIGDFGTGGTSEVAVASAIRTWVSSHSIDALMTTGDNVYERGAPSSFDDAWRRPYGWLVRAKIPVYATIGNHDILTRRGRPVMDLLGMPAKWYTHAFPNVSLIVLDGNNPASKTQLRYIREKTDPHSRWTIALFHQPIWSCSLHGTTPDINRLWLPLFRKYGIDLILNGHDHAYQRFGTTPPTIVTGGGGASLYGIRRCPPGTPNPKATRNAHHFLYVEAGSQTLRVRAIDITGNVFDDFTYR